MTGRRYVTTGMVKEIRRRRADGELLKQIAETIGIHIQTVWKYSCDENLARANANERNTLNRIQTDPVKRARRQEQARRYQRKLRAAAKAKRMEGLA